jgi:hypothetical protein
VLVVGVASARPAATAEDPRSTTDDAWGLPGFIEVGLPAAEDTHRLSLRAAAGYGYTEALEAQPGPSHRADGTLAFGLRPLSGLDLGLRLDGRYDVHPNDAQGGDYGLVGDPRLVVRYGSRFARGLHAGFEGSAWFPGRDAPSLVLDATTLTARALFAWRSERGRSVGFSGGFRFDQSGRAEEEPETLRRGDRIALGLSDSHAVVIGLAYAEPLGPIELIGEVNGDLLVGPDAPSLAESPIRVQLAARRALTQRLGLEARAALSLSGRPAVTGDEPLVPIEPRVSAGLALTYRFLAPRGETAPSAEPSGAASPSAPPVAAESSEAQPLVMVRGTLRDESGAPVPDAAVTVVLGKARVEVRTAAGGEFDAALPAGSDAETSEAEVAVVAEGFEPVKGRVRVGGKTSTPLELTVVPAVPAGQLKGLVRSFDGAGMKATIRVPKAKLEVASNADGEFVLDVPPGSYVVEIEAPGYVPQKRVVRIENRGVTVLNADLRRKP